MTQLTREFDLLRERSETLASWDDVWNSRTLSLRDWMLADAWFRSRSLELPRSGTAMVPVLDMANHSASPTARYEETDDHEALLLLRPDARIVSGDEITITYGEDKSAAEILFSYGFIDTESAKKHLVLPVPPIDDDPLMRAKSHSFGKPPVAEFWLDGPRPCWKSPFAFFLLLNEEDGLEFRTLQEVSGAQHLRVFWQGEDVTDRVEEFEDLVGDHPLRQVFRLRVVAVLEDLANTHLVRMREVAVGEEGESGESYAAPRPECAAMAKALRDVEMKILESVLGALGEEVSGACCMQTACLGRVSYLLRVHQLRRAHGSPNCLSPIPFSPFSAQTMIWHIPFHFLSFTQLLRPLVGVSYSYQDLS
jgi:hypothetical protein